VAAMLLAWPLGRVCDRFDRRRVMFWVALAAAASAGGVAVLGASSLALLTLLVGLFTGLSATLYAVAVHPVIGDGHGNRIQGGGQRYLAAELRYWQRDRADCHVQADQRAGAVGAVLWQCR